jgi:chromosome segregation ATPase
MSRALTTYEDFKRSWMRITAKGRHASLDAIYEDLGRRGSKSTLQKYRVALLKELSDKGAEILPATIPPDMVPLIEEFFTKSVAIAGEVYQSHRKDLERQLEQAFTERTDVEENLKESERIRREQASLIESLQDDKEKLQASVHTKNTNLIAMSEKKAVLESEIESQRKLHERELEHISQEAGARYQSLKDRLEGVQRQANDEKTRADKAVKQADNNADHFLLQIEDERRRSAHVEANDKATIQRLESQLHISQKREDGLAMKFSKAEERFFALQGSFDSLKESSAKEVQMLTLELSECKSDIKWLERQAVELQEAREHLVNELDRIKSSSQSAASERPAKE